jgi:teichuronic acid biosynthesis protein TuaE
LKKENLYLSAIAACYGGLFLSYGPLYLCHILMLASFAVWIFAKKPNVSLFRKKFSTLYLFPIFIVLWYALSITWAIDMTIAAKYLFYIVFGTIIALSIVEYAKNEIQLSKLLRFTGVIVALELIVSTLERLSSFRWPISPYSPMVENFGRTYKLDEFYTPEIVNQLEQIPTGFHWNPNNTAVAILICIPFFLFSKNWILKIAGTGLGVFVVASGNSRLALLSLALLIFASIFYLQPKLRNITLISGFIVAGIIAMISISQKNFIYQKASSSIAAIEAMFSDEHRNISSVSIRRSLADNSTNAVFDNWGQGVGGGNSVVVQQNNGLIDQKTVSQHNFWLELLVEGGALFFLAFLGWLSYVIFRLIGIYKQSTTNLKRIAGATSLSLVVFCIACLGMSSAIYFLPMWILLGVALASINIFQSKLVTND